MAADLLAGASWSCAAAAPGAVEHPDDLDHAATTWLPASVPGTAAGALRAAGQWTVDDDRDFDAEDWLFRFPVRLVADDGPALRDRHLVATCDGTDGVVTLTGRVAATFLAGTAAPTLRVGDRTAELDVTVDGEDAVMRGSVTVAGVERWWPHSHGPQPRYAAALTAGDHTIDLGHVGFRTVAVDETAGGFTLLVNGEPVFCRGACWVPPDIVSLTASAADVRAALELARDGGMNMVRLTGTMVYEDAAFWDA